MQTESDAVSLDMEDHYKRIYRESMDILKQLDVVSTNLRMAVGCFQLSTLNCPSYDV